MPILAGVPQNTNFLRSWQPRYVKCVVGQEDHPHLNRAIWLHQMGWSCCCWDPGPHNCKVKSPDAREIAVAPNPLGGSPDVLVQLTHADVIVCELDFETRVLH